MNGGSQIVRAKWRGGAYAAVSSAHLRQSSGKFKSARQAEVRNGDRASQSWFPWDFSCTQCEHTQPSLLTNNPTPILRTDRGTVVAEWERFLTGCPKEITVFQPRED